MNTTATGVTTSVSRRVAAGREQEFLRWTDAGMAMAGTFPGFLGGGWLRAASDPEQYHVVYRFADEDTLDAWTTSPARKVWVGRGTGLAQDTVTHRLTGVEGWFEPQSTLTHAVRVTPPPPRWKQAVTIWLGFFPISFLIALFVTPRLTALDVVTRTLVASVVTTPVMVFVVLPFLTGRLRRWLHG